jgi:hydroxyacylglutathione hydrolase
MGSVAASIQALPNVDVTRVPAFEDNYLWLIHGLGDASHQVVAVDPGDADRIEAVLSRDGLTLTAILLTHHHRDHTGGVDALLARHPVPVYGPAGERVPLPGHPIPRRGGDRVDLDALGLHFDVLDVPGHTAGHIAYVGHGALFCGDTLFSGGCGKLFEGTAAEMLQSLDQLATLPADTLVYCAHEYTMNNLRFARQVEPTNRALTAYDTEVSALRTQGLPTVPTALAHELAINPFLRSRLPAVRAAIEVHAGKRAADDAEAFLWLREWKNGFKG